MEEDRCGFAAVPMMPLHQTSLYGTHHLGKLAAEILAGPLIDVSAKPRPLEDFSLGLFVHEQEAFAAQTASSLLFPRSRARVMVLRKADGWDCSSGGQCGPPCHPSLALGCGKHPSALYHW